MIELPNRVAENIDGFTGRAWLLPRVLEWCDQTDERILLLTGPPGTGKSMIAAWLAGRGPEPPDPVSAEQLKRLRSAIKAAHFCQAASRNISPQAFAQSVANQLTHSVTGFGDALAATLTERVSVVGTAQADTASSGSSLTGVSIDSINLGGLGDELSFDRAFTEPLKKLYATGYSEPLLILVDALDEALGYTGDKTVPELLSTLGDLPFQIRILVTTRDDPRVLAFYDDVKPWDLIRDALANRDDVHEYVTGRLAGKEFLGAAQRINFARRVALKSAGVFLYAAVVLDELLRLPQLPSLETYPLPNKLSGLYRDFLKRELGTEDKGRRWHRTYKLLLGLIAVAQDEGLTDAQLSALTTQDVAEPLDACKQYFSGALPNGPFRLFHKSFADFLLEDKDNVRYHIDATTMHKLLADHYWSHRVDWSKCDDYGLNNLAAHLSAGNRVADLVELIDQAWMRVRFERAEFTYSEFQGDIDLAWRAVNAASLPQLDHLIHLRAAALAVQEQVNVYEDEDLALLVGLGRTEEALKHARLRNTAQGRFQGILKIYRALVLSERPTMAMKLSSEARTAANAIGDAADRVEVLCYLSRELSRIHDPEAADVLEDVKQCVHGMQDKSNRAVAERNYVCALLEATRLHDAEQVAASIDDDVQRAFALQSIAIELADSGRFDEASQLAGSIESSSILGRDAFQRTHATTLAGIARALAAVDDSRASAMFDDVERATTSIEDDNSRNSALEDVAAALTHAGRISQAQRVATGIGDWHKSSALTDLIRALARMGDFDKAKALVDTIPDVEWRPFALHDIVRELAAAGRYDEARSIQRGFNEITSRASALCAIARELLKRGDDRAPDVVDEAIRLSAAIESPSARAAAFRNLANILVEAKDLDQAGTMFEQVHHEAGVKPVNSERCAALREVAIALASVEDTRADTLIDTLKCSIESLQTVWEKKDEKRQFATALTRVRRFQKAWEVLESDRDDLQREVAWCELAIALANVGDNRADPAFENALQAVQEIGNDQPRDEALAKLAAILVKASRFEMAEGVIGLIERVDYRSQALTDLAIAIYQDNPTRARELLTLAESVAFEEWTDYMRDAALVSLVSGLASLGEFDEALRVSSTVSTGGFRVAALCYTAERLVQAGDSRGQALLSEGLQVASSGNAGDGWPEARELRKEAARLSREGNPKAVELWVRAQDVAGSLWADWIWEESQNRAEGMVCLAIALAQVSDPRADSTFDLAHRTALAIPYDNSRDTTLNTLVRGLIEVGRLDAAERVFSDIHGDVARLRALRYLVEACTAAGRLDSALHLARSVPIEYQRREIMRKIGTAFARNNKVTDAIQILEETSLDGFICSLAAVYTAWTAAPRGEVIASMRAVTKVAAWVRSDWKEIHDVLMT